METRNNASSKVNKYTKREYELLTQIMAKEAEIRRLTDEINELWHLIDKFLTDDLGSET